jgi:hypothetical protein
MFEKIRTISAQEEQEERLSDQAKEVGPSGERRNGIMYEERQLPDGELERLIHFTNPYNEKDARIITLDTRISEEDFNQLRDSIIPIKEFFSMLMDLAEAYNLQAPVLLEGPSALGKTFAVRKFVELLYGPGFQPFEFVCNGQTDTAELMARWTPNTETSSQEGEQSEKGVDWKLEYGAVPKAMTAIPNPDGSFRFDDKNGEGFPLLIDELGLAEPAVTNSLLKLRGTSGGIASGFRLWEGDGRHITAGRNFWFVACTNPPEDYKDRNEIDAALARGMIWKRLGDISEGSLKIAAEFFSQGNMLGREPRRKDRTILDYTQHPELAKEIATVIAKFHQAATLELKAGEPGRRQKFVLTMDHIARTMHSLRAVQVRDSSTGLWDITSSLSHAVETHYIDALMDANKREKLKRSLKTILTGEADGVRVEGSNTVQKMKDVLEELVERFSITPEERAKQELAAAKSETAYSRQFTGQSLEELITNTDIPEQVRASLQNAHRTVRGPQLVR